jgi:ABC-type polysaccharide/polyol phosphate export permease
VYADLVSTLRLPGGWLYSAWITFLIRYRKTLLGPLWVIAGPAMFVLVLGTLFERVTSHNSSLFVPHLAIGFIAWNYITNITSAAPRLFANNKAALLHGPANHLAIALKIMSGALIVFLHQAVVIAITLVLYDVKPTASWLLAIPALALLLVHSLWVLVLLGIIGARYRDLAEMVEMVMRIAFLATPIIWMPGEDGHASIVGIYLAFNPFYHILEPLRGAILNTSVALQSWIISATLAALGLALASAAYRRYRHLVVLWT